MAVNRARTSEPAEAAPEGENFSDDVDDRAGPSLLIRLHRSFGPLVGGMILDAADLLTPGSIGLAAGLFIGMPIGWWISSIYEFTIPSRLLCATLAGVYCMTPGTELIPLATIISAIARFFAGEPAALRRDREDREGRAKLEQGNGELA